VLVFSPTLPVEYAQERDRRDRGLVHADHALVFRTRFILCSPLNASCTMRGAYGNASSDRQLVPVNSLLENRRASVARDSDA